MVSGTPRLQSLLIYRCTCTAKLSLFLLSPVSGASSSAHDNICKCHAYQVVFLIVFDRNSLPVLMLLRRRSPSCREMSVPCMQVQLTHPDPYSCICPPWHFGACFLQDYCDVGERSAGMRAVSTTTSKPKPNSLIYLFLASQTLEAASPYLIKPKL